VPVEGLVEVDESYFGGVRKRQTRPRLILSPRFHLLLRGGSMGLIRRTPGVFCFRRAWRRENTVYLHHIGHPVGADSMGAWNRKFLPVGFFQYPHSNRQRPWGRAGSRVRNPRKGGNLRLWNLDISKLKRRRRGWTGSDGSRGFCSQRLRLRHPLSDTSTYLNTSLFSLGMLSGAFVFSWGLGYAAIRRRTPVRSA
jgi:hypothetical protein